MPTSKCVLCSDRDAEYQQNFESRAYHYKCPRCGDYWVDEDTKEDFLDTGVLRSKSFIISGIARRSSDNRQPIRFTNDNMERLIELAPIPANPFEYVDQLFLYIGNRTRRINDSIPLNVDDDYPVIFAKDAPEFRTLLDHLQNQGLIARDQQNTCRLTWSGWSKLESLRKTMPASRQGFVAMWFDESVNGAWTEGIRPALTSVGYNPVRIDGVQHNGKICDRIVAEIRRSGLMIADFTGNRGGVYFEAGYAMGLNIPVIWTCHKDHINEVHFDTRQYNHIVWTDPQNLRLQLKERITATQTIFPAINIDVS